MSAVLIVSSTRAKADAQEVLRLQDIAGAYLSADWAVDLLVPGINPLIAAALDRRVRIFTVPRVLGGAMPVRPCFRRLSTTLLMFFRATALANRRDYDILFGIDDGAAVVRGVDRATVRRNPYIVEMRHPINGMPYKGLSARISRSLERGALKYASAVIAPDQSIMDTLGDVVPKPRTGIIPDPHAELTPDAFTYGEFSDSIIRISDYAMRAAQAERSDE